MNQNTLAKALKTVLLKYNPNARAAVSDITVLLKARGTADYSEAHKTKLYRHDVLSYCILLYLLSLFETMEGSTL